jgi:hypothetical protein
METTSKAEAARKLALAGQQAGLSIDKMIQMLDSGLTVEILLCLIECRLRVQDEIRSLASSNSSALLM